MVTPNILIVDDSAVIRHTARKALEGRYPHFELQVARNGREAQRLIVRERFHLILCDWEMPEMGGDELLTWLRRHPDHRRLPFIMVTSRTEPKWVQQAARLGVDNYLAKPFTAERIAGMTAMELLRSGLPDSVLNPDSPLPQSAVTTANGFSGVTSSTIVPHGKADVPSERPDRTADASGMRGYSSGKLSRASTCDRHPVQRLVVAELRRRGQRIRCLLETLGASVAKVVIPSGQVPPSLSDQVVFEVHAFDGGVSVHLNACVTQVGWHDPQPGAWMRNVDLVFVDENDHKDQTVQDLIARLCAVQQPFARARSTDAAIH